MQAKDQLKQRLEQSTRTQRIILFPLTLAAVGGLAMLFSINRTEFVGAISSWESRQYDPELGLKLAISGCDVTLSEGTSPTIKYTSIVGAWSFAWRYAAGTSIVEQWFGTGSAVDIDARNAWDDCAAAPFHDCAVLCHVMVSVPPEATNVSITVEQVADDAASPKLTVQQVALGSLLVGSGAVTGAAPTLSVELVNVTIARLQVTVAGGSVSAIGGSFGSFHATSQGAGSVYRAVDAADDRTLTGGSASRPPSLAYSSERLCVLGAGTSLSATASPAPAPAAAPPPCS